MARCMSRLISFFIRVAPCRCLDGHVKEPYEMNIWRWEPDHRFNFFNPPAHRCAVTYITEISLRVTLTNQSHSLSIFNEAAKKAEFQNEDFLPTVELDPTTYRFLD